MRTEGLPSLFEESGKSPKRDLQDLLSGVSDRGDLERLFQREIPLADILRLVGRGGSPSMVVALLESRDPARDIRRLKHP